MLGKIIGIGITGAVGLLLIVLGCLIRRGDSQKLLHDYHIDRVAPENRKAYCKLSGAGILMIGVSLVLSAVIFGFTDSARGFFCFAAGFAAGLAMLIAAGRKHNR